MTAEPVTGRMRHQVCHPSLASTFAGAGPCDCEEGSRRGSGPVLLAGAESSQPATSSPRNFPQRKGKVRKGGWSWRTPSRMDLAGPCNRGQTQGPQDPWDGVHTPEPTETFTWPLNARDPSVAPLCLTGCGAAPNEVPVSTLSVSSTSLLGLC